MQKLDKDNWERANLVKKYSEYVLPYVILSADVDVTGLYRFAKKHEVSFYCAMIHTVMRAAQEFRNLHYRVIDGEPYLCERLDPNFTHMAPGSEDFMVLHGEYCDDLLAFCKNTQEMMKRAEEDAKERISYSGTAEVVYITCIPWIKYTQFIRTIDNAKTDNIPRFSWGKYEWDDKGRLKMPFSVQAHHALADGYHVAIYMNRVQELLDEFEDEV